ncbi:hypothetical protein MKK70_16680 [Methylobacterium sp. E-041]|jgi:hypothetical protein|uniref:DUF6894 family protein n=1 Tax=unclassified Methylobacterium TaxID=2615210 RepID=UPI0011C9DAB9|nr:MULTISPECIES: hypothetical protein [unclassified Methylobacterium]MCJ2079396.1 hypothetical protein [Methylobacterium sp. E-016]MCJ2106982.1 hypothetical protein [Methylobacterium sp. E-041]MCJ2113414.1 hypothetical protein [Methylobacterium sp. E-025]TXM95595.1 hypothetical protein FV223_00590 [Methylobacterium sp. WL116]TXN40425.1 hypothetical protein FV225_06075 [Methylobacterium sp. WL93]
MPLFYIDLHDGTNFVRDTQGFDLPDIAAAQARLVQVMRRVAQLLDAVSDRQDYLAIVRDQNGKVVMRATLTLDLEEVDAV